MSQSDLQIFIPTKNIKIAINQEQESIDQIDNMLCHLLAYLRLILRMISNH